MYNGEPKRAMTTAAHMRTAAIAGPNNRLFLRLDPELDREVVQAIDHIMEESGGDVKWHSLTAEVQKRTGAMKDRVASIALAEVVCRLDGRCRRRHSPPESATSAS